MKLLYWLLTIATFCLAGVAVWSVASMPEFNLIEKVADRDLN